MQSATKPIRRSKREMDSATEPIRRSKRKKEDTGELQEFPPHPPFKCGEKVFYTEALGVLPQKKHVCTVFGLTYKSKVDHTKQPFAPIPHSVTTHVNIYIDSMNISRDVDPALLTKVI